MAFPHDTNNLKNGPREALDIAYRVCAKYYEMGCPETTPSPEADGWYSERLLSGGTAGYKITNLEATNPRFTYTKGEVLNSFNEGAEAYLKIEWGRAVSTGPMLFHLTVSYPKGWDPLDWGPTVHIDSFERHFVPDHITAVTIPHLSAKQEKIFEWINTYIHRPREATAAPGIEFFAGAKGVKQIESEILNVLISDDGADIISPEWAERRFEISFEYASKLLRELWFKERLVKLKPSDKYYGYELYGSVVELNRGNRVEQYEDDLIVKYRG